MDIIDKCVNAELLAVKLTALVGSVIRNSDMDPYDKWTTLNTLIEMHEQSPLGNSEKWISEWREEFKDILAPASANPVGEESNIPLWIESDELPY